MQTITSFFENNKVAIVDFCFNAGYVISMFFSSCIILFFFHLYMKKRYGFKVKEAFDYLHEKIFDYFMMILFIYFAYAGGIKTGLSDSVFFDTMSVYVFSLVIIPVFFTVTFLAIFLTQIFEHFLNNFLKRGVPHDNDNTENTDICDISDSTPGGFFDDTAFPDD